MDQTSAAGAPIQATAMPRKTHPEPALTRLIIGIDRAIYRVARNWLLAVNALFSLQFASVLLAPVFVATGAAAVAGPIYRFNGLFCHQRDDRTFALLREEMACCQRCAAIYAALTLAGIAFAFARPRLPRPSLIAVALLAAPILIDGGGQLAGLWSSTPITRVATGATLGVAICWVLLPYLDRGFTRMRAQLEILFARLVAEGRARPL
jgi:uncharacterized membrane protein